MDIKNKLILFAGETYYPHGGANDIVGFYKDIDSALSKLRTINAGWWQLLDFETMKIVEGSDTKKGKLKRGGCDWCGKENNIQTPWVDNKMFDKKFKCDQCGETFKKTRPEEEVMEEKKENGWGDIPMEDMARVCDVCYKKIMGNSAKKG